MIEIQLKDKSFIVINPQFIMSMKSNKTKEVQDAKGNTYNVNDWLKGDTFTITMIDGTTHELSKLGINILRKRIQRADFDPAYYSMGIASLRK